MNNLSQTSIKRLQTCDKQIQKLIMAIAGEEDILVIEGHRSAERQAELLKMKATKVKVSKHNSIPSRAIDIAPAPLDWDDIKGFYSFGKRVVAKAKELNIPIRWGGDWDGDGDYKDQTFNDLVHFELV